LENVATAQPGVNLFPSATDYQAGYNGILRVGIAFSMWLATGIELVFTKKTVTAIRVSRRRRGVVRVTPPPRVGWFALPLLVRLRGETRNISYY
jgi:hypothetical protein